MSLSLYFSMKGEIGVKRAGYWLAVFGFVFMVMVSGNVAKAQDSDFDLKELVSAEVQGQIIIRNYTGSDAELTDGKSFFYIPADGGAIIPCQPDAEYNFSLNIETDGGNYFNEFDSRCGKKFTICEDRNDGGTEI